MGINEAFMLYVKIIETSYQIKTELASIRG